MTSIRKIIIAFLLGIVAVGALIAIDNPNKKTSQQAVNIPGDWQTYTNPVFDFTFRYPPNAEIKHEGGGVKVQYVHPKSGIGEITDGYTFYVNTAPISDLLSLKEFSHQRLAEEHEHATEILEKPNKMTIGSQDAFHYAIRGPIGSRVDKIQMESSAKNKVLTFTYIISGPEDREYSKTIDMMIRSAKMEKEKQ